MNCFNHRDVAAIGLCKSCGKALCGDCLAELPNGIACKGSCESRVEMIDRMIDSNAQVRSAARHQVKSTGLFSIIIGVGFCVFAVWSYQKFDTFIPYLNGFIGLSSLILGILRLSRKEEYPKG
jgi:hypothetical protein